MAAGDTDRSLLEDVREKLTMLEGRVEELERLDRAADVRIKRVDNGFRLKVYDEEAVFEDDEEVEERGVQPSAVRLLHTLAFDYLSMWMGNDHTRKRVFIRVQDGDDERHKKLMALLGDEGLVDKVWAIMEKYDEI